MPTPSQTCCAQVPGHLTYVYIYPDLTYYDPITGLKMNVTYYMGLPISQTANRCLHVLNMGAVVDDSTVQVDPSDCPCCNNNGIYVQALGQCYDPNQLCATCPNYYYDPIPCVICECVEPPPFVCETCQSSGGLPISFVFDPTRKQCTDCEPLSGPRTTNDCDFNKYFPSFLIDPIINFRLKR